MYGRNLPIQKKQSVHTKSSRFQFDANTDQELSPNQESLVQQKLKRQEQPRIETQKHQKIVKKHKIDDEANINSSSLVQKKSYQPNQKRFPQIEQKKTPKIIQSPQLVEQKSLQLLKELVFNKRLEKQESLITSEIANKWILQSSTPIKIKSFLALHMILHNFEGIEFQFRKTFGKIQRPKKIEIIKVEDKPFGVKQHPNYVLYKKIQFKKYLLGYLEWLIDLNEDSFERGYENSEFWDMAFNKCEESAMRILMSTNQKQKSKKVNLAPFFMNAEDFLFRSLPFSDPKTSITLRMNSEDMAVLPECHWILALNFSLRYFYQKGFNQRAKTCLENVSTVDLGNFYQEYQLLRNYFDPLGGVNPHGKQPQPLKPWTQLTLSDQILEWVAMNSGDRQEIASENKLRYNLVKILCITFMRQLQNKSEQIKMIQDKISLSVKLVESDRFLPVNDKENLLKRILYQEEKVAYQLGKKFPQIIEALSPSKFVNHLSQQYSQFYSHLILSEHPQIKNDLLAQLKHLTSINFENQDESITNRIKKIICSFHLLSHWNKDVLKAFVFILKSYIQSFRKFLSQPQKIQSQGQSKIMDVEVSETELRKHKRYQEMKEFEGLSNFLKVHLNLLPLNIERLSEIIQLINSTKHIPFQQKTVTFMKKNILSILFAKNGFHRALLLEMKKNHADNKKKSEMKEEASEKVKICLSQYENILEELKKMAQGISYAEEQVELLLLEAKSLETA